MVGRLEVNDNIQVGGSADIYLQALAVVTIWRFEARMAVRICSSLGMLQGGEVSAGGGEVS